MKSGYPPKTLTIVPELPLASLGLKAGDQIIVGQKAGVSQPSSPPRTAPAPAASRNSPANAGRQAQTATSARASSAVASNSISSTPQLNSTEPDAVRAEGGFLIHRVSAKASQISRSFLLVIFT